MGWDLGPAINLGLCLILSPGLGPITVLDLGPISVMIPSPSPSSSPGQLPVLVPILGHRVRVRVHFWVWDLVQVRVWVRVLARVWVQGWVQNPDTDYGFCPSPGSGSGSHFWVRSLVPFLVPGHELGPMFKFKFESRVRV